MGHITIDADYIASLDSSYLDVEYAETLPPECYTSKEFFEFEKEVLFTREWLCVGRDDWLPEPGSYFTTRTAGEPIVVARNQTGEIHAMSSVCQHRAMLVAEGSGKARNFLCPYHHWSYSLEGELLGIPEMQRTCDFDKSKFGLPKFKIELWNGFIFINMDLNAQPLAPRLEKVTEAIASYGLENAKGEKPELGPEFSWNWKVMFENNNDGYHASRLHHGPLHDFIPSGLATFPEADPADAGYLRFNGTLHSDASFNPTQKALLPIFPGLSDEERNRVTFANVPPSLSLVMTSDLVIYLILRPTGPESLEMDTGLLVAPKAMRDPAYQHKVEAIMATAAKIIDQDFHVDVNVQRGLRSRYAVRGRYSWQEGAQVQFNRWLIHRFRKFFGATPRLRAVGS
jgi:phenylpropionate dioxygenase-like ring-hydroxylating dioxygenase large terminal subunit